MYCSPDKLRESYIPHRMPGREAHLQRISDVLDPATDGEPAGSCWEIGPSGVGKTSAAKRLLRTLREDWGVGSVYISCVSNTRWEALQHIAEAHPSVMPRRNLSTGELLDRIADPDEPFVIILDEVGGLEDPDLLTDLASLEWLSLILIGHRRSTALDTVPDPVDRLRYIEVVAFDPYDDSALFDILDARREVALQRGVVSDGQLERIIAKAGGSARFGVQALRSAVEVAIERGHTTVQEQDIADCFERAHERIREQQLASLSRDHHLVYQAVRAAGPLHPQGIYERYVDRGGSKTRQAVVTYRQKLAEYDLLEHVEEGWRAVDETLAAPLAEKRTATVSDGP